MNPFSILAGQLPINNDYLKMLELGAMATGGMAGLIPYGYGKIGEVTGMAPEGYADRVMNQFMPTPQFLGEREMSAMQGIGNVMDDAAFNYEQLSQHGPLSPMLPDLPREAVWPVIDTADMLTGMAAVPALRRTVTGAFRNVGKDSMRALGGASDEIISSVLSGRSKTPLSQSGMVAMPNQRKAVGKVKERVGKGNTGKYVGAPNEIDTPEKLAQVRKDYMETALLGEGGREWYGDSSNWILNVTPDNARAQQAADVLGVSSQGTGVDTNLGFGVKAMTQDAAGSPINTGRFPGNQSPLITQILSGERPNLGPKRQPYADNLSVGWHPFLADRPVHDIWQGRAFGYKNPDGTPWDAGFSPQQHAWMDEQMDVVVPKLNASTRSGFDDWNNMRAQAAAWTGAKILAGELDPKDAAKHYGDFSRKYMANATYERVPGAGTGHLQGLLDADFATRKAYSDAVPWTNKKGQDLLYTEAGLMTEPTTEMTGVYTPRTGKTEFNSGNVAHPLVGLQETGQKVKLDAKGKPVNLTDRMLMGESEDLLSAVEGFRGAVDIQNAGAAHKVIMGNAQVRNDSIAIPMTRKLTEKEAKRLNDIGGKNGFFVIDSGNGVTFVNDHWSDIGRKRLQAKNPGSELGKAIKGDFGKQISKTLTDPQFNRVEAPRVYIDYESDWAYPGSGKVTRKMLDLMDKVPPTRKRIGTSDEVKQRVSAMIDRDIQQAASTGDATRQDLLNLRETIANTPKGKNFFDAIEKGLKTGAIYPSLAVFGYVQQFLGGEGETF